MMAMRRTMCQHGSAALNAIGSNIIRNSPKAHTPGINNDIFRTFPQCTSILSTCTASYFSTDARDAPSSSATSSQPTLQKRLDVALVGAPNAGKSQLLNSLIGTKVAAVSRKRHTTRTGILGARTFDDTQIVFIDTPGYLHHEMSTKEGVRKLLGEASSEMESADYVLLVVDAAKRIEDDLRRTLVTLMFLALKSRGRNEVVLDGVKEKALKASNINDGVENESLNKFAFVLNKVDLVNPKEKLLLIVSDVGSMAESCIRQILKQRRSPLKARLGDLVDSVLENYTNEDGFDGVHEDDIETFATLAPEFFFTSAITKNDEGVDDVLGLLLERATPSDMWIVDPESTSAMSPTEQVEEIIREKIYRCLHREVPHCVQQQNRMFKVYEPKKESSSDQNENKGDGVGHPLLRIHQDLVVKTKSHQRLVLGSGGRTLERIRTTALRDLEEAFDCKVDLVLHVKITKSTHDVPLEAESMGAFSHEFEK